RPRARRTLKPILETLAGIPRVVIGFFALTVINPVVVQGVFGATNTFTMMAAGIGVGILTIPLIASVAEDAMHAVPGALREAAIASLAIGSDQVKTVGSGLNAFEVLYLLGLILFVSTLLLNLISERFVR